MSGQHRSPRCGKAGFVKNFMLDIPSLPESTWRLASALGEECTETISSWSKVIAIHIHHHYYYNTNANERRCNGDFTDTILKHDNSILLGSITSGRHLRTVLCLASRAKSAVCRTILPRSGNALTDPRSDSLSDTQSKPSGWPQRSLEWLPPAPRNR
ncbi:hypothetical protein CIHG_07121 [Coccidioides immitis H538.4]|uniref:Uncharacterized protein n=1 Tax=Coccidioides immitis H538.4 TaxID=396776 RepID=A0A0J8RWN2_COCIT|nr:hypothetical protein CIHG_07121 [Coccidioides immitis H538.4]